MNTSQTCERKSVATEEPTENVSWDNYSRPAAAPPTFSKCALLPVHSTQSVAAIKALTFGADQRIHSSKNGRQLDDIDGRLVTCRLDELRPHPSYARHHLTVPTSQLSALAELGDLTFREPLVITRDRIIVDGYARVELARPQGRVTLPCIAYELTSEEAFRWLLQKHRRSNGLNDFTRILLTLELETWFREKARSNQQVGGQKKGSSKLTEAERLDVRSEIAAAAGVSVGNVTKVKQLKTTAQPELLLALRSREISIHRAWLWSKASAEKQRRALWLYQTEREVKKTIRTLVSRHRSNGLPTVPDLGNLIRQLSALETSKFGPVRVAVIKAPGKFVFLTEELSRALESQEELTFTC